MSTWTSGSAEPGYYGAPIVKAAPWKDLIAGYFFTGGLAGGSSVLSLVARMAGNETLARRSLYVGAVADIVSPALLVSDLGRPERFLNMFRVFKVTSPMSVGSWILGVSGGASATAALLEAAGRLKAVKLAAEVVSALSGAPLAVYTATLVSDTAIPAWHEARKELPFLFGSSAVASAGAAAAIVVPTAEAGPARRLAVGGVLVENAVFKLMEKRLGMLGEPYSKGESGKYKQVALACTTGGAALLAGPGRKSRLAAAAGGALVLAGEVAVRWSVFKAGFQSARDPKYTVLPQRERQSGASRTQPGSSEPSV